MTKRLFTAIRYKPDYLISELIENLKIDLEYEKIKWVDTDNMHLTVKFYGDTETAKIPELIKQLNTVAENNKPMKLSVTKTDAFFKGKFPSVLFFALSKNDELFKLADEISKVSEICGFPGDKRKFKAHITLARFKQIKDLHLFNDLIHTKVNQSFSVDSFLLFESKLSSKGPLYSVVEEFFL